MSRQPSPRSSDGGVFALDRDSGMNPDSGMNDEGDVLAECRPYRFELERREFLRVLGGGVLIGVAFIDSAAAQETARARGAAGRDLPAELSAWIHIGKDGQVTGYTGKVEIGQNIRTSLAQAIGDELRIPVDAVTLVMADTALTPYDAGTFGSRTTPYMAPQMSKAAATAREMLIDLAAKRWQADRRTLQLKDGRVVASDGRTAGYGELTQGQKLTGLVLADIALTPADKWTVRGTPIRKINGPEMVTGRHQYTVDITRPNMVYGRVIRPDSVAGTLGTLDDSRLKTLTAARIVRDGDFVGVIATTERLATRAAAAVQAPTRVPEGLPSSKTVFEHLKKPNAAATSGRNAPAPHVAGDVGAAAATAAKTFTSTWRIPYIAHVPLEPRAAVAEWTEGQLTVWTNTQRPFGVRSELAEAFRLPEDRVRVIVPDMGSAYGGKHTGEHAIEAARLAKAATRPVKVVWTRAEEFMWGYFRPAGVIEIKATTDANRRLLSWEFDNWNSGAAGIRSPYETPHQRIAFHPSDSPLRQGAYRGLAATANHHAREMQIDQIARDLGVDPVQFRLQHLKDERMRAVLTTVAEKAGWPRAKKDGQALGIACGTEKNSYVAIAAELTNTPTAFKVDRLLVVYECGAIVNPEGLRNQVDGCVVQALGGALFEAIDFADGRILNGRLASYRVPRFGDMPVIETILLNRPDLPSAGAGETPIVAVAPAIGIAARTFGPVTTALPIKLEGQGEGSKPAGL